MFTCRLFSLHCLVVVWLCVTPIIDAGYTSEETDEKSKSLYSAVTSILNTSDNSRHQHKHTNDEKRQSPCVNAGSCSGNIPNYVTNSQNPCFDPNGCSVVALPQPHKNYGPPATYGPQYPTAPYMTSPSQNDFYGGLYGSGYHPQASTYPVYVSPPQGYIGSSQPVPGYTGAAGLGAPPGPYASYNNHQNLPSYGQGNSFPNNYGYQGERGYSVFDHSLKSNSEYTEVGTHNGPLQQAPNGYGYGSGYGGYMGMYNRPGF